MEACSLHSPTVTTVPSSLSQTGFIEKPLLRAQVLKFSNSKRYPNARKLGFFHIKAQTSGTTKFSSGIVEAIPEKVGLKDENLAFVAGATGKVGSRTVRELLKLGFQVRAGVRSAQRAESLVQSVKQMKLDDESAGEGTQPVQKLEIVECDLEKPEQIGPALGNASVVLCCIGASEKEVFDITGPYRIDYLATKNLIEAATVAKVNHFILLTSLGTNKFGFPAAILNLFWGVLIWKRKAEEALIASGLPYTIVRPGGMERPTDAYKETHNTTLSKEDTLFGGQVSNLQVAELLASTAKNPWLSYFKVVEVIAETTAPLTPLEELLAKIPSQRAYTYSQSSGGNDVTEAVTSSVADKVSPQNSIHYHSPYYAYDDFKPPSSPSPTPPILSELSAPVANNGSVIDTLNSTKQLPTEDTQSDKDQLAKPKPRPLSPFYMYEELKPPASPIPSLKKS